MKKNILYLIVVFCFIVIFSCVGVEIERTVQDNTFYSSSSPKLKVETNPDFNYIGKVENTKNLSKPGRRNRAKFESYIFGEIERNLIEQYLVAVRKYYIICCYHKNQSFKINYPRVIK